MLYGHDLICKTHLDDLVPELPLAGTGTPWELLYVLP
jgi:hypothetical protein